MKKKDINRLREEERVEIKNFTQKDILRAKCDHRNADGKPMLKVTDNPTVARCKICGALIDTTPKDLKELKASCGDIIDTIQYIKAAYKGDSEEVLEQLGTILLAMKQLPTWYANALASRRERQEREEFNGVNGQMFISTNSNNGFGFGFGLNNQGGKKKHKKGKKNKKYDNFGW